MPYTKSMTIIFQMNPSDEYVTLDLNIVFVENKYFERNKNDYFSINV